MNLVLFFSLLSRFRSLFGILTRGARNLFAIVKFLVFAGLLAVALVYVGAIPTECATSLGAAFRCSVTWTSSGWR